MTALLLPGEHTHTHARYWVILTKATISEQNHPGGLLLPLTPGSCFTTAGAADGWGDDDRDVGTKRGEKPPVIRLKERRQMAKFRSKSTFKPNKCSSTHLDMEAFMARAAGEKPPAMGYMDCPGLRNRDTLSVEPCLFPLPECAFYSQPSKRMCDLSHSSGRDGVTGSMRAPGHT